LHRILLLADTIIYAVRLVTGISKRESSDNPDKLYELSIDI